MIEIAGRKWVMHGISNQSLQAEREITHAAANIRHSHAGAYVGGKEFLRIVE